VKISVPAIEGTALGTSLGPVEGGELDETLGFPVSKAKVGQYVNAMEGDPLGPKLGQPVDGCELGATVGESLPTTVGCNVGMLVLGMDVGTILGIDVGCDVGMALGASVMGGFDGRDDGDTVGAVDIVGGKDGIREELGTGVDGRIGGPVTGCAVRRNNKSLPSAVVFLLASQITR
jgi:hypothetical protein